MKISIKLDIKDNIKKDLNSFEHIAQSNTAIDQKLDELLNLLSISDIDSVKAREFKQRFNTAVEKSVSRTESIEAFRDFNPDEMTSRDALLDEFSMLLSAHEVNSKDSRKYLLAKQMKRLVSGAIGIILIALGFAMIVMPAPPYFEMFTIFYFNREDGVTLMDLISLLIVFTGIYLFIRALIQPSGLKK
ncbi:hypothetical protein GCM10027037_22830 [Mucilaginibacter koreensis]